MSKADKVACELCDLVVSRGNLTNHQRTLKCQRIAASKEEKPIKNELTECLLAPVTPINTPIVLPEKKEPEFKEVPLEEPPKKEKKKKEEKKEDPFIERINDLESNIESYQSAAGGLLEEIVGEIDYTNKSVNWIMKVLAKSITKGKLPDFYESDDEEDAK